MWVGRGSGSFIGGHLIGKHGIREAFRIMGLGAVIAGLTYAILHFFWLKKFIANTIGEEDTLGNS